ncbi:hypothetical protein CIB95_12235 [Lottiidibacillus patelloidae]|uniref:DUF4097 domain-containing protein n=1 Tax=Lottiidibacillus patelloidae TaxID=2670334 RepID=A0A263BS39_9BACI|nr:DUF4097 family beta strand repeat-containing protein [Lottiidibacillus patelloidae]OZM56533.1 hypothetical protein CIB95_12235 [Lottiidibacillus patelloidae]
MEQEKKKILEAIASGHLTSEEGFQALQALERSEKINATVENGEYKQESLVATVGRVLEKAVQKLKEIDLDFNFGEAVHVTEEHTVEREIKNVKVNVSNGSITFQPRSDRKVKIFCDASVYGEKEESSARSKVAEALRVVEEDGSLRIALKNRKIKANMTIELPTHVYESLEAHTYNGKIENTSCDVANLKFKTVNGSIFLKGINGENIEAETINGKVQVDRCFGDVCEVETINGKIDMQGSYNKTDLQTTSGKITYQLNEPLTGELRCKSEAGKICVTLPRGMNIEGEVETMFGGMSCKLDKMEIIKEKKEVVKKEIHFTTKDVTEHRLTIDVETTAGSIEVVHPNN